ncbi:GSCOCG00011611001-RA-CDS, partial [Cotesia congregata]
GLTSGIACGTYIVYQIFGTAEIQPWNYVDQKRSQPVDNDIEPLNDSNLKNGKNLPNHSNNPEQPELINDYSH